MGSTQSWIFDKLQLFKVKKLNNTLSKICQPFRFFDKKLCEAVYWIMIFEHCDRDGRTLGKSDKGESHFFINIRIYSLECWNYVLTFGLLLWYWCAWIWHLVLKWPSDRKWNNIVVTSSWGLLFDLSLNWTTYPGTNGQKMDQAVMILMLLKRIRNFKLEPLQFQIVHQILMSITNYSQHTLWVNWPSDLAIVNPQNWHFSFSCQNKMLNSFPLYL